MVLNVASCSITPTLASRSQLAFGLIVPNIGTVIPFMERRRC